MDIAGRTFFFHGVGGMGMSPLALYLKEAGSRVFGYDDALTPRVRTLLTQANIDLLELPESLSHLDYYIRSSAILNTNPVYQKVRQKFPGAVCYYRGEVLAKIAASRKLLAVAGSHGKTTTTAMLAHMVRQMDLPVCYLIGGLPDGFPPAHYRSDARWLIAEIDESDGTIENFFPEIALFLNFDWDHPSYYKTKEQMEGAWTRLGERTKSHIMVPSGCPSSFLNVWEVAKKKTLTFAPVEVGGRVSDFNSWNYGAARAALTVMGQSLECELSVERRLSQWANFSFPGVYRRQTWHWEDTLVRIVEDYAHHPTEITCFLYWLRDQYPNYYLHVFFQPHRYSRTRLFVDDLAKSLSLADEVFLFPVYGAGEKTDSATGQQELEQIIRNEGGKLSSAQLLEDWTSGGDLLCPDKQVLYAFVGAGDQNEWAPILATLLQCGGDRFSAFVKRVSSELTDRLVLREDVSLATLTTIRVGGNSRIYAEPADISAFTFLLQTAHKMKIPCVVLGNGSNVLVGDGGYDGLVICLRGKYWSRCFYDETSDTYWVGSGLSLQSLSRRAAREGWAGFEFLEGIPGTVGGALQMNAGAMGGWFGDLVVRVEGLTPEGKPMTWCAEDLDFQYRSCTELKGHFLTGAWLKFVGKDDPKHIRKRMKEFAERRRKSQPGGPSAGCMFRNPEGYSAGRLIDSSGLKGFKWGGMQISSIHANFLQQIGDANAEDVLHLLHYVRSKVAAEHGVWLEPEVRLIGANWRWEVEGASLP